MKLINGKWTYQRYGSIRGYYCTHCARVLAKPASKPIYNELNIYHIDGIGRVRCGHCNNLAERV